ncbi:heterokaryon incompatibility protein-domain-containing protein [Pyrenochaeta sp. MPI-SDFR-AT-0127]|nr:heterokaryon incompatibility protein-domain-containing protein [Pyrenochaeta sp. MPI-SDFR-AT-0127]
MGRTHCFERGAHEHDRSLDPLCRRCLTTFNASAFDTWDKSEFVSVQWRSFIHFDKLCKLCCLLLETIKHYGIVRGKANEEFELWASKDASMSGYAFQLVSKVGSAASGWLTCRVNRANFEDECLFARDTRIDKIDWRIVRQWLDRCNLEHGATCTTTPLIALPGFQVLDCQTRQIVSAPRDCKYAALSYVWGNQSSPALGLEHGSTLPVLVEDAVMCTQAIGLRYLWVDRYCINQNADSKHVLIQNMDTIYSGAAITIINAAGESSNCGLPGLSQPRTPLRSVSVNGMDIIMIPNTKAEIANSKWCSRGWTYQKSTLSCRRLVFTSSQLYFQCLGMHGCELIPVCFPTQKDADPFAQSLLAFRYESLEPIPNQSLTRIREYLCRELSFDSDILSAIMGILKRTGHHFWGLPFDPVLDKKSIFLADVTWFSEPGFLSALLWGPEINPKKPKLKRRTEFPSWSWVGWQDIAGLNHGKYNILDDRIDMSLEIKDRCCNRTLSIEEYALEMRAPHADMYSFEPCLYTTGWVTKVQFLKPEWLQRIDDTHFAVGNTIFVDAVEPSSGSRLGNATLMTSLLVANSDEEDASPDFDQLFDDLWTVLLFITKTGISEANGLILKPRKHNIYERLGVLHGTANLERDRQDCEEPETERQELCLSILEGETASLPTDVLVAVDNTFEDSTEIFQKRTPVGFIESTDEVRHVPADERLPTRWMFECEKHELRLI